MCTNNSVFSAMAATACRVLAEYGEGLPEVAGVQIQSTTQGSHPARFRQVIALQQCVASGDEVDGVAQWAAAFGAPVRLIRHDSHVQVSTQTVVDGHSVLTWDHITPEEADAVVAALGERLDTVLDIDPAALRSRT
jgi:hypothetical protein